MDNFADFAKSSRAMDDPQLDFKLWLAEKVAPHGTITALSDATGIAKDKITRSKEVNATDPKKRRRVQNHEIEAIVRFFGEAPARYEWALNAGGHPARRTSASDTEPAATTQKAEAPQPNAEMTGDLPPLSQRAGARDLPMRGIAVMGEDGDFSFNGGDPIDYIPRPAALLHKRRAFGVYATNDSMEPAYSDGDPVVIDPDRPPAIGDDVVIELKPGPNGEPGACYLKRLVKRGPPTYIVKQFNPPMDIPFPADRVLRVYRVVPRRELLGL